MNRAARRAVGRTTLAGPVAAMMAARKQRTQTIVSGGRVYLRSELGAPIHSFDLQPGETPQQGALRMQAWAEARMGTAVIVSSSRDRDALTLPEDIDI